jgi:hypothetical protein
MSHYSCHYSIFIFDVFHAPSDTIKGEYEWLCSPKSQKGAKERKVKDQIANVGEMFLLIVLLK